VSQLSPFSMVHTLDQWRRVAHDNTALEETETDLAIVQLAWLRDDLEDTGDQGSAGQMAGMAFDPWCRLYRSLPDEGQIERSLWAADSLQESQPLALFAKESSQPGDFKFVDDSGVDTGPLSRPVDVAVDFKGRLYIAEYGNKRVLMYDLLENKLIRHFNLDSAPLSLTSDGNRVWVVLENPASGIAILSGHNDAVFQSLPDGINQVTAITILQNQPYIIDQGGTEQAKIMPLFSSEDAIVVPYASDILSVEGNILVVARRIGEDFLRFEINQGAQTELPHLKARHYQGTGIVITPEGDIAYWSDMGLLRATLARVRYETSGKVTSFQLDSGEFQMQWGRIFIDACIPRGTEISAQFLSLDEIPQTTEPLPRTPPENAIGMTIYRPDLSAPMPPEVLLENLAPPQSFYRRRNGREIPWQTCLDDAQFQTYEAPVIAPPGRYLWVILHLTGTSRLTPKIKSLRAQYPAHDLLRRLPQVYSREAEVGDFLRRYLSIPEGELREMDMNASFRHLLLDPYATPAELLPWLGGFMGLVVDKRWPECAKRGLIDNAIWLFRYRGTVMGLIKFVEIYLGVKVTIVENFKLRGLGGALLGQSDAVTSNTILGAGFRIGGKLGEQREESVNDVSIEDSIKINAHRFNLIIAASLTTEQREVVELLLETHRPAHTLYNICTADAGMRIGIGLHTGLNSIVGNTSGFGQLQVGASLLGYSDTVGAAKMGTHVGSSRLGNDTRAG